MTKARHTITIFITALMMCLFCMLLTSCGKSIDIDTSGMLLVIYDGNGGYLGNKTATARKLYTHPGSKIPDYPMDYATSQYTVPSLGLAMRDGYQLLGWYANAEYTLNPEGDYLFLKQADGISCGKTVHTSTSSLKNRQSPKKAKNRRKTPTYF